MPEPELRGPTMNVLFSRVALRDRTTADVLDLALRFLVTHRLAFAKAALVVIPPNLFVTYLVGKELGWGAGWLFAIYASLVAQAPFTELASRLVFESNVRVRDVLRSTLARTPFLVLVRGIHLGVLAFASMFFLVPALFVGGYAFFLGEVMILERATMSVAIPRLQRLAAGATGDAVLGVMLLASLHVVATVLGDVAGRSIMQEIFSWKAPLPAWESGMGSFLSALGFWLFLPYVAVARLLMYLNVRTRAEGWDVQTRFMAIARRAKEEDDEADATKPPPSQERAA